MREPGIIERQRVLNLSDLELLNVIRGRAQELVIARAFQLLVNTFKLAQEKSPEHRNGLEAAINLTKLLSQKFAPGDPFHPYKDFGLKLSEAKQHVKQHVQQEPAIKETTELSNKPKAKLAHTPSSIKYREFSCRSNSKMGRIIDIILEAQEMQFRNKRHLRKVVARHDPSFTDEDITNAIVKLRKFNVLIYNKEERTYSKRLHIEDTQDG